MYSLRALIALLWLAGAAPAWAAAPAPDENRIAQAARALRADPLLNGEESRRVLKWIGKAEEEKPRPRHNAQWLRDFIAWLERGSRLLVWLLAALGIAWLLWRLRDYLEVGGRDAAPATATPSHVQALDIRPESLPEDIAAQASALWRAGQPGAALSLLYRGALSRLVHRHGVAIRAGSTEGDCLRMAQAVLHDERARHYFTELVRSWQLTVYAARPAPDQALERLCRDFALLDAPAVAASPVSP